MNTTIHFLEPMLTAGTLRTKKLVYTHEDSAKAKFGRNGIKFLPKTYT